MSDRDPVIRERLSLVVDHRPLDTEARLRALQEGPRGRGPRRAATIIFAFLIAIAGIGLTIRAFTRGSDRQPGASPTPTGQIAYFAAPPDGSDSDVYTVNADGSNARALLTGATYDFYPAWSRDGSRLAFARGEEGDYAYEVYVMNADGSGLTRLTNGDRFVISLSWSPDGSRIAFVGSEESGFHGIYVINADGTGEHRVFEGQFEQVAWAPDGTRLAVAGDTTVGSNTVVFDIYVMNADGTNVVQLTDDEAIDYFPMWSPDGSRIAFMRNEALDEFNYRFDVYVMNADGTGLRQLTDWPGYDAGPVWSPDGGWIAFGSDRDATPVQLRANRSGGFEGYSLYIMRPDGTDVQRVLAGGDLSVLPTSWRP